MFKAHFLAALLLLSGLPSALVYAQTDNVRPRRTQTSPAVTEATDRQAPSPEASAEAERLYNVGVKYGRAGLFKEAVNNFEQAVKLNPDYADAYLSLGHAYYDLHLWEQAIESLKRGLALKPKDKDGIDLLAHARFMLKRETGSQEKDSLEANDTPDQADGSPASLSTTPLSPTTSKHANDIALTKVYRVGPGDVLEVRLTDAVSAQPTLFTITPAGLLEHPDLNAPLPCAGLTVEEITARIEDDLKQRPSTKSPANVSVAVNEYVSHTILVSGLVKEPGTKILRREAIPLYVVVADAQPLPEADRVTVLRNDSNESYVIDPLEPSRMNMLVRPGDVITLQANPAQFFYVGGEVKSPGEKRFRRGLTLTQAIIAAGGLARNSKEARLARDNGKGFLVVSRYKLKDIDAGKVPDPVIQPGDRITIMK
ncbi:MAG TPA: tetratricopeptide repeat protein [Blastocatellia bacterium]|nr:tetratricopeptide repeat protein [Blastocatellia bacterium]